LSEEADEMVGIVEAQFSAGAVAAALYVAGDGP